jgi:hypothetical protein
MFEKKNIYSIESSKNQYLSNNYYKLSNLQKKKKEINGK